MAFKPLNYYMVTILDEDRPIELKKAQQLIGGHVKRHILRDGTQLLFDEKGKLKKLPRNSTASLIAGFDIVGPALWLKGKSRLVNGA